MSESNSTLTTERLRQLLHYEPETGAFTWLARTAQRVQIGDVAGSKNSDGYLVIAINRIRYKAHRLAWLYMHGVFPANHIDHIDGNPSNNRITNLRDVTRGVNMQNQRKARTNNKLGILGVICNRKSFRAEIMVDGNVRRLGTFKTPELAHQAYLDAKRRLHPACTI